MSVLGRLTEQRFEAAEASLQRVDWTCPRCEHHARLEVLGSAHVQQRHSALADGVRAKASTEDRAALAANADVARAVALVRCPRCGRRDTSATWRLAVIRAAPLPGALAGLGLLGAVGTTFEEGPVIGATLFAGFAGVACLVLAFATPIARHRLLRRADRAVEVI